MLPAASTAVTFTVNGEPWVVDAGAATVNAATAPTPTVTVPDPKAYGFEVPSAKSVCAPRLVERHRESPGAVDQAGIRGKHGCGIGAREVDDVRIARDGVTEASTAVTVALKGAPEVEVGGVLTANETPGEATRNP